jgi:SAM-dependent methyltransferase
MNLFQSIKGAVGLTPIIDEAQFKQWRRESTDPAIRSGACYVPMPGKEKIKHYRDKQNRHHLGRYEWAKAVLSTDNARPLRVLDCACGVGYGTAMLAEISRYVDGVDIFKSAIRMAKSRYGRPNITWHEMDAADIRDQFADATFDAVVSFQTIECLEGDQKFLGDVLALLKPGGKLLIDTPARNRAVAKPDNPHHLRYYSVQEWIDMLMEKFEQIDAFDSIPEFNLLERYGVPSRGSIAYCTKTIETDSRG